MSRSSCRPAAKESVVYANADEAKSRLAKSENFVLIDGMKTEPDFTQSAHAERLARIKTCEETGGEAPCKIGEIILEAESESATGEVWRRQQ